MTADELIALEAEVAEHFNAGRIRAPIHLSGGNESQLIELFERIEPEDWVATSWRSHYHAMLKGVPREHLMAEILAGRSITLNFPEQRIVSSAIVGGALPIATGIALAIKRTGGKNRVWAFIGDMAATTGIAHECAQYANGHKLPLTIVCESNGKSVCSETFKTWGGETNIAAVADEYYDYELPWPHAGAGQRVQF